MEFVKFKRAVHAQFNQLAAGADMLFLTNKVFEVLADKMKTPYQEHQLSGLGFSSTMRNSVIVKVDGTFSRTLKVNF